MAVERHPARATLPLGWRQWSGGGTGATSGGGVGSEEADREEGDACVVMDLGSTQTSAYDATTSCEQLERIGDADGGDGGARTVGERGELGRGTTRPLFD